MELSADQCTVLASTIPVLMLAIGVERVALGGLLLRLQRLTMKRSSSVVLYVYGVVFTANSTAFVLALYGVNGGAEGVVAWVIAISTALDFMVLIAANAIGVENENPRRGNRH